jgi:lysophospholipase L1-like esterase
MGSPITLSDLVNAGIDANNMGKIINGASTDPDVVLRNGGTAMTLRKVAATMAKGDTGAQGIPGEVSKAQLGLASASVASKFFEPGKQLYNPAAAQVNKQLIANGTTANQNGFTTSDYIPVGTSQWICNRDLYGAVNAGQAYYDAYFTFISINAATVVAGTATTPPAGTAYMRFMVANATNAAGAPVQDVAGLMFNLGTAVATYKPYGYANSTDVATVSASIASQVASGAITARQTANNKINLFDATRTSVGALVSGNGLVSSGVNTYFTTDFMPVLGMPNIVASHVQTNGSGFGYAFYKADQSWLSGASVIVAANTPIAVPTGAYYARLQFANADVPNKAVLGIYEGTAIPASYKTSKYLLQSDTDLLYQKLPSSAKKWGVFGDSYSGREAFLQTWQNVVSQRLQINQTFQDAIAGRKWGVDSVATTGDTVHGIFSHYGGGAGTGTCDTNGVTGSAGANDEHTFGCVLGQTLAQNLAALDIMVVPLGTNDYTTALGTAADDVTAQTIYGTVKNALTSLITANKSMRILVVGPAWTTYGTKATIAANDAAIQAVCESFAVPYLSMFKRLGMNDINRTTISDGVHPTIAYFGSVYGPTVAGFISQNA